MMRSIIIAFLLLALATESVYAQSLLEKLMPILDGIKSGKGISTKSPTVAPTAAPVAVKTPTAGVVKKIGNKVKGGNNQEKTVAPVAQESSPPSTLASDVPSTIVSDVPSASVETDAIESSPPSSISSDVPSTIISDVPSDATSDSPSDLASTVPSVAPKEKDGRVKN